jgi:hypothetical protein
VYGGGEGTYLVKAESISDFGVNPDATTGVYQWVPGVFDTPGVIYGFNNGAPTGLGNSNTIPAFTFMLGNASQARCIAACLEISYPGAESGRAGRVHYGHGNGGVLDTGFATSTAAVAPLLEMMERTPTGKIEIIWKPGQADGLFRDPSSAASQQDRERRSALLVAWAGLPLVGAAGSAGVGLTIKQTAVYEYQPIRGTGLTIPHAARTSSNSMQDVMRYLTEAGAAFARSTANKIAANLAYAATSGAMGYTSSRNARLTFRSEL